GLRHIFFAENTSLRRMRYVQFSLSSSDCDIAEPSLFFQVIFALRRTRVREETLLEPYNKDNGKLEPFCRMDRHQRNAGICLVLISIGHQGRMIYKILKRFALLFSLDSSIHQLLDIQKTSFSFDRLLLFKRSH